MKPEPITEYPKDVVCIYYIWWAMQRQDRWMWCAQMNDSVIDYHSKDMLKKMATDKGLPWIVIRHCKRKKGDDRVKMLIVEKSDTYKL